MTCPDNNMSGGLKDYPFIRQIRSPITAEQLRPLDRRCQVVQFDEPLSDNDFQNLSRFMEAYPSITLRIFGHYGLKPDLSFLKWFPFVRSFQADVFELNDWEGLSYLPSTLEYLGLGQTKRRLSLKPISRFENLNDLYLEGHHKDIEVLEGVRSLRYLTLRSISLPNLQLLQNHANLLSLALKLGGTRDLALLPHLANLRYLEIWMVRELNDLDIIADLKSLRYLFLQDLKNVTRLSSFRTMDALRRCHVENLKGLSDLTPISEAPNLEEMVIVSMNHLRADDFRPFKGHPTLRAATIGLGSMRRNSEASACLGLPPAGNVMSIREYVEGED
jgi:hypothetical protein